MGRPMALLSAVATLLAALFVCLGMSPESREHHPGGGSVAAVTAVPPAPDRPAYVCPYDSSHCGVLPHLSPAVLTVPPPAAPVTDEPLYRAPPAAAGPAPGCGAPARAPGRHVLQVMRT
ncbi:hypothetical protein [Streptomyces albidochromogenes]|uniref:Secreted protein n=1 Tax=Streptomyces albidochromogenes TaxID=329524 RepID=A0ABW6FEH1_9ACTN